MLSTKLYTIMPVFIAVYTHKCISVTTSKIHYCIGSLNVGVALRVQHFSAFHDISSALCGNEVRHDTGISGGFCTAVRLVGARLARNY